MAFHWSIIIQNWAVVNSTFRNHVSSFKPRQISVSSCAVTGDRIWRKLSHKRYIWTVCHQCVYGNDGSAHLISQTARCSLPMYIHRASRLCVFVGGPSGANSLCRLYCSLRSHTCGPAFSFLGLWKHHKPLPFETVDCPVWGSWGSPSF